MPIFEAMEIYMSPLLFDVMEVEPIVNFAYAPEKAEENVSNSKDFEYVEKWKKEGQSYGDTCKSHE